MQNGEVTDVIYYAKGICQNLLYRSCFDYFKWLSLKKLPYSFLRTLFHCFCPVIK